MADCNTSCCDGNFDKKGEPCENDTTTVLDGCVPLPLPEEVVSELVPKAKDYALLHGAGMRFKDTYNPDTLQMAPFFLVPSTFPRREFDRVVKLQPLINILMHRIAHDHDFLEAALKNTIKVDDFTARLWKIYLTVREEGVSQEMSLGLVRSDVMLTKCHAGCCQLCQTPPYVTGHQVEVNTIASGFGHMGPISGSIHRYVLGELRKPELLNHLPENNALAELCGGMIAAWEIYGNKKAVILFLIEDVTYNICDQRFHEYEIRRLRPDIHVIRRNLTQMSKNARLTDDKRLIIDGDEIAVVYFRAGYEPGHYHSEKEWEARLTIERSRAIKSPSIQYHLAGTKKVQQEVARLGVLRRFLSEDEANLVGQLFTGLYSLDLGPEGDAAVKMAMENPDRFVLKPQREGGGNNMYGAEIKKFLESVKDSQAREAYILMDKIRPPIQYNYLVRGGGEVKLSEVVSELGIFGVLIGNEKEIKLNKFAGHMLRTKLSSANEGGVAAGFGALDSVFLFD